MPHAWQQAKKTIKRLVIDRLAGIEPKVVSSRQVGQDQAWLGWVNSEHINVSAEKQILGQDTGADWVIPMIHALERRQMVALAAHITNALLMRESQITPVREHMAHYTRDLFVEGEINFPQFIDRLRNLYPDAMGALPPELKGKIAGQYEKTVH